MNIISMNNTGETSVTALQIFDHNRANRPLSKHSGAHFSVIHEGFAN